MLHYTYDQNHEILFAVATGKSNLSDVKGHYLYLTEKMTYPKELKVLIDIRQTSFEFTPDEINEIYSFIIKAVKSFDSLKEAILAEQPYETALATLFNEKYTETGSYEFKVFSTKEAAVKWLKESS